MGYYLTMQQDVIFRSPLSLEELQSRFNATDMPTDFVLITVEEYLGVPDVAEDTKTFCIKPDGEDYYAKFNTHDQIPKFVSSVISPDDYAQI